MWYRRVNRSFVDETKGLTDDEVKEPRDSDNDCKLQPSSTRLDTITERSHRYGSTKIEI